MENSFAKDLSSYISFALKVRPSVAFPGHYDEAGKFVGEPSNVQLTERDSLSKTELSTLGSLMEKFKLLKPYLRPSASLDSLKIVPKEYIEPKNDPAKGVEYKKITVNAGQLDVAKHVSKLVAATYKAHTIGNQKEAKDKYGEFVKYLAQKRKELIGEFQSIGEIEDSLALYGVGLNHADNGGAVIFVLIEIAIAVPVVSDVFNERPIESTTRL